MRLKFIILMLLILSSLSAQEGRVAVHLTNGERFEGYIEVTDDERFITLALDGTRLKIPRAIVERVVPMHRELKLLILCHPDQSIAEQFREELERGVVEEDVRRLLELSHHPSVATDGRTGFLTEERLPDPLASEVFAAEEGEVVGPLSVNDYYYVIKVETVRWVEPEEEKRPKTSSKKELPKEEAPKTEMKPKEGVEKEVVKPPTPKNETVKKSVVSEEEKKESPISITVLPFKPKNEEADLQLLHEKVRNSVYKALHCDFTEVDMAEKAEKTYSVTGEVGAKDSICSLRLVLESPNGETLYDSGLQTFTRKELENILNRFIKELEERLRADRPDKEQP